MSESSYKEGFKAGRAVGYGSGWLDGFWCGVCAGLATWPVAVVGYLVWRAFS